MATKADYSIEELRGNVYIGEVKKIHPFHEELRLVIGINLTTEEGIETIDHTLMIAEGACGTFCAPKEELRLLEGRYNKLTSKTSILHKLLGKQRYKRGLANFIGKISKTYYSELSPNLT